MTVITKDQMAKTVAKVLYERFIAVLGVLAKLLTNCGANFTLVLVEELCAASKNAEPLCITHSVMGK